MVQASGGEGTGQTAAVVTSGALDAPGGHPSPAARFAHHLTKQSSSQLLMYVILIVLLFITFVPIIYLVALSLKDNGQIYGRFWSMPNPYRWENFGLGSLAIWRSVLNSILTSGASTVATVILASLSGYVFARHRFPRQGGHLYRHSRPFDDPSDSDHHSRLRSHSQYGARKHVLGTHIAVDVRRPGLRVCSCVGVSSQPYRKSSSMPHALTALVNCRASRRLQCRSQRRFWLR